MAELDEEDKGKKGGGKKKPLMMIIIMVVLLGVGTAGSLYFMGMLPMGGGGEDGEEQEVENTNPTPIYFAFEQPFTVNFETQTGLRFLQVSVEMMTYDPAMIEAVKQHLPVIKNNVILMFSAQKFGDLVSREGKEKLRAETLTEINGALTKYHGKEGIEEIYFTSFVIQ